MVCRCVCHFSCSGVKKYNIKNANIFSLQHWQYITYPLEICTSPRFVTVQICATNKALTLHSSSNLANTSENLRFVFSRRSFCRHLFPKNSNSHDSMLLFYRAKVNCPLQGGFVIAVPYLWAAPISCNPHFYWQPGWIHFNISCTPTTTFQQHHSCKTPSCTLLVVYILYRACIEISDFLHHRTACQTSFTTSWWELMMVRGRQQLPCLFPCRSLPPSPHDTSKCPSNDGSMVGVPSKQKPHEQNAPALNAAMKSGSTSP
jgi:hypothetical protein